MADVLKQQIIAKLAGQQGCSVNELFMDLRCSKNDFIKAKEELIKQGVISIEKEGKQKTRLILNRQAFSDLDSSFMRILKSYSSEADTALKRLKKLRPLFKHIDDNNALTGIQATNPNVAGLLSKITRVLEAISHYTMIFTLRYHIDSQTKKFDLKENQKLGFEAIQKIIDRLIEQHKDEEKELRNYLLWRTTSSFSYVL